MIKLLERFTSFIAWLQIVFFPLFVGAIAGLIAYNYFPGILGLVIGIGLAVAGLIAGLLLARWAKRKHGTVNFISRVSASPELDHLEEENR
jgi:membrane associated rhomboid family serine protease